MSEYHPNVVRPMRPKITLRRLINMWPLMVWLALIGIAAWFYKAGVHFSRMNAAVDVLDESITPLEEGVIAEIFVKSGETVKPNDKIGRLDTSDIDSKIKKLEFIIAARKESRVRDLRIDISRLADERRDLERRKAGEEGELAFLKASLEAPPPKSTAPAPNSPFSQWQNNSFFQYEMQLKYSADKARLEATTGLYVDQIKEVNKEIDYLAAALKKLQDAKPEESDAIEASEMLELEMLRTRRERLTLKAAHEGIVDRTGKQVGEYLKAGEAIAHIISNARTITGFLPQDQMFQIKVGQDVWVASGTAREKYFKTKVMSVAPQMTSVPDASSPLPHKRLHGQEVIVAFPDAKENGGHECRFVPGQTIMIQLEEPGNVPILTSIFGDPNASE